MYSKTLMAGWADMDFNSHMKNTAFLDKAADVRLMFFTEHGFPTSEFSRLGFGPIVIRDEVDYRKEVSLLDEISVTLALGGMATDGSRWLLETQVLRQGRLCARVRATGAWLDLTARRLIHPPAGLLDAMSTLDRTRDFEELRSNLRPSSPATE